MEKSSKSNNLPLLAGLGAACLCIMFGANTIAIKMSLHGLGVYFSAGLRFAIASTILVGWALLTKQSLWVARNKVYQLVIISVAFSIQLMLHYVGISQTSASRSSLILNLQPFFVLFLAHFFIPDDKITLKKIVGIVLGFAGIILVFTETNSVSTDFQSGEIMILVGTVIWGGNAVYIKRVFEGFKPLHIALYPMVLSIPLTFTASYFWDSALIIYLDANIIGAMIFQSVLVAAFGYVTWNALLEKYGTVSLHSYIFVMPITGVILGGLILGEPITYKIVLALLLIVTGLLVSYLKQVHLPPIFSLNRNV